VGQIGDVDDARPVRSEEAGRRHPDPVQCVRLAGQRERGGSQALDQCLEGEVGAGRQLLPRPDRAAFDERQLGGRAADIDADLPRFHSSALPPPTLAPP
jgi:hypothetical protein